MTPNHMRANIKATLLAVTLLLAVGLSSAQTTVYLTAAKASASLPDGSKVPMWGFACDNTQTSATAGACSSLNAAAGTGWAPPLIVVPASTPSLTIHLTNTLLVPTSVVILGQLGGGLGTPSKFDGPAHDPYSLTWPVAGNPAAGDPVFTPPKQGQRAQSFGVEAGPVSGTADYTWANLKAGTYLIETGTHPSIQAPMGLYGVLVVTAAPVAADATAGTPAVAGQAHPGAYATDAALTNVPYDGDAVVLLSEIDPKQNALADAAAHSTNGQDDGVYPPAVNFNPMYYLVNGKPFDKTTPAPLAVGASATSGNVLFRFVNAGLKTHVPSVVGLPMSLIAEDGNVAPGNPKVQSEVHLAAGKTFDVLVHPAQSAPGTYAASTYPFFDRQLSLSTNNQPDGGMQGLLNVAGGSNTFPGALLPQAINDTFTVGYQTVFNGNVLNNDIGIYGATVGTLPANGTLALNQDGSFVYTPGPSYTGSDTFTYYGNGNVTLTATVNITVANALGNPTATADSYVANTATLVKVTAPGVLANDSDPSNLVLTAVLDTASIPAGLVVKMNADGSFSATAPTAGTYQFQYHAANAQQSASASVSVTLNFPTGSGINLSVVDAKTRLPLDQQDYRWTLEEDTTWATDLTQAFGGQIPPPQSLGTNFHKSHMPLVATGCTGPLSCADNQTVNNGTPVNAEPRTPFSDVALDPAKRYYVSILPGDAGNGTHTMGGANIAAGLASGTTVTVGAEPGPLPPAQLSVFIFDDNNPTNGDVDNNEAGLGGFEIVLLDVRGSTGDPAGQITYDVFGMPLTNSLLGTPGCPAPTLAAGGAPVGVIYTCPDGSPLAGQALIKNLAPLRYDVVANPGAARESRGEKWTQVSTLEGTFAQDAFAKAGEPAYFQEFGAPGFHSFIGFVNMDRVNTLRRTTAGGLCRATVANPNPCPNSITGTVTNLHMDRPPQAVLHDSTTRDALAFTTCYVGLNSSAGTGADIAMTQCDDKGNFSLTSIPNGTYNLVIFDQWLDQIIAYKAVTVPDAIQGAALNAGPIPVFSWFTNVIQSAYIDSNKDGVRDPGEPGISQVPMTVRFRDGSISNLLSTDSDGYAPFNQLFPLFNWYVVESDTTRYKGTGIHIAVDGGGAVDTAGPYANVLTSHYPTGDLSVRTDAGSVLSEGLQGFVSETEYLDWGKTPYDANENGGITGMVYYAPTRGFDDPRLEVQFPWSPAVPRVQVNLYQETSNADGTQSLQLVDSTTTSSWDDSAANLHCPGQDPNDPFVQYTIGAANVDKCYDGMHNFNQVQPTAYDGRYRFPSATYVNGTTDPLYAGKNMLSPGKYVSEVVPPSGYEIVKEEDKNILIGDAWDDTNYQGQFAGLGNLYILPDQATVNAVSGTVDPTAFPPCVGAAHRVPDFVSLFPGSGQFAPFTGQDRPLCNRKEVTLANRTQANSDFQIFTPAPVAAHFTGMMLNDAASEFSTISPSFGEKSALPNAPVSIRDFNGVEIERVYTDKWGQFNGLTPSTWEANIPNPSGYAPNMMITCMNDPGPIPDPNNPGQLITDPQYNPMFSNFCYTWPFMPGITTYLDTPVLPVAAFASDYNPVDCAYPDTTPAIARVDGSDATFGPWLSTSGAGHILTITALRDKQVPNPAYAGPAAASGIATQKLITRHYDFGTTAGTVSLGGTTVPSANVTWGPTSITVAVPGTLAAGSYELGITRGDNGKKSVDTVTVTIGGTTPIYVTPATTPSVNGGLQHPIQDAIDAALPGDLIMLQAGSYPELVVMWKPMRLQGVGAASVVINATKYPTQKLQDWRVKINSLFGVDPVTGNVGPNPQVDPLPGQEITGGVVQLEPSVLSTEEGAGITVVAKRYNNGNAPNCANALTQGNPRVSNFYCKNARIDGVSVTGGDAGGGIYVNGWAHNLEISNNRVYGNAGPYNGGVRIGQPYLEALSGGGPFNYDDGAKIHHNSITTNGTVEANAAVGTVGAAGAGGGLSLCTGTDNYKVNYNFICGNYSSGDGGGIGHIGLSRNGNISNNWILFNQSYNQSSTVSGGGLVIEGEPGTGTALTLGTGDVTVDSNLIQGNFAEAGNGGGVRLQNINGADVSRNPNRPGSWWKVTLTNNMIVNNVAGTAGGGISLSDALNTYLIHNTVASNDSAGISGPLFNTRVGTTTTGPTTAVPSAAGISSESTSAPLALVARAQDVISNPVLTNDIVWHNRSFFFDSSSGTPQMCSSNNWADASGHACRTLAAQTTTGECAVTSTGPSASYWDLGVVGDQSATPGANRLNPTYSVLTSTTGYVGAGNHTTDPLLTKLYCNGSRVLPGTYWEPQQPFIPPFQLAPAATLDEAGNFVDLRYGPLSLTDLSGATATFTGDYHIQNNSSALDAGVNAGVTTDFDGQFRPSGGGYDIGADELLLGQGVATINPNPVAFGGVLVNTTVSQTVTVSNTGTASMTISSVAVAGLRFAKGADTCTGAVIPVNGTCTVVVTFNPNNTNARLGTLTFTDTAVGNPQVVQMSGQGGRGAVAFSPSGTLDFGTVTLNTTATMPVTVTNNGTAPLAITNAVVSGTRFGKGTDGCTGVTLPINGTCTVNVTFNPNNTNTRTGSLRLTDNGTGSPQSLAFSGR